MFFQDGNALFQSLIGLAPTFGGVSLQMLSQMTQKQNFIFSTDSYHEDSIKGQERARRRTGDQLIIDVPAIRIPNDFKLFLSNDRNKEQLCHVLKSSSSIIEMVNCNSGC